MRNALVRRHPSILAPRCLGLPRAPAMGAIVARGRQHDHAGASEVEHRLPQGALEVVEAVVPALLVRAHRLFVPQVAVGEADDGGAVDLLEVDLDQLPGVDSTRSRLS